MKSALLLLYNVELYPAGQHTPKLVKYQGLRLEQLQHYEDFMDPLE